MQFIYPNVTYSGKNHNNLLSICDSLSLKTQEHFSKQGLKIFI